MSSPELSPTSARFRGPWSYLGWLVVRQRGRVLLGAALGTAWTVGLVVPPYLVSRAVDGLASGRRGVVLEWTLALLGMGAVLAWLSIWRHRTMTKVRMDAAYRTVTEVDAHVLRLGASLARRVRAGEVVAIGGGDAWTIGRSLTVTGPGVGAVVAYGVVAVLLLRISVLLAVVVLVGVPLLVVLVGPALRSLRRVGEPYREQQGRLTHHMVDVVGGLRVLNGLGGKDVYAGRLRAESQELRRQGYRVGRVTSVVQAIGLGLPTLYSAAVVWLAARLAVEGSISIGQLVAVYGYVAVLAVPVGFFVEAAVDLSQALVAGRRVTDFLGLEPEQRGTVRPPETGALVDEVSGLRLEPGTFVAVATARQSDAEALVDRMAGLRPGGSWSGRPLTDLDPGLLHQWVLVADNDAALFAGPLAAVVAGRSAETVGADREGGVLAALHAAGADDVVDGLPAGLHSPVEPDGSNLSGGQRQRVRLARAIFADPDVLLAIEPTSAVDAVTEAVIVDRLTGTRRGRTTLVTSTSSVVLQAADTVHLLVGDRVVAVGRHVDLLRDQPAYAALVLRGQGHP